MSTEPGTEPKVGDKVVPAWDEHPAFKVLYDHYRYLACPVAVDPVDTDDCANVAAESVRVLLAAGLLPATYERVGEVTDGPR